MCDDAALVVSWSCCTIKAHAQASLTCLPAVHLALSSAKSRSESLSVFLIFLRHNNHPLHLYNTYARDADIKLTLAIPSMSLHVTSKPDVHCTTEDTSSHLLIGEPSIVGYANQRKSMRQTTMSTDFVRPTRYGQRVATRVLQQFRNHASLSVTFRLAPTRRQLTDHRRSSAPAPASRSAASISHRRTSIMLPVPSSKDERCTQFWRTPDRSQPR